VGKDGVEIARLGSGDYFGEAALLSDAKRGAGVQVFARACVSVCARRRMLCVWIV
jgi:CRP-like cAMP-binding protein